MAWNFKDLTGQRFGRLVVQHLLPKEERPDSRKTYWVCLCDCGNTFTAVAGDLQQGRINSCKCLRNTLAKLTPEEVASHRRRRRNDWLKKYRAEHPVSAKPHRPRGPLRFTPEEIAAKRAETRESQKQWREYGAERKRCWRHGVTLERYRQTLAAQGGACAICKRVSEKRALSIDHDHAHCPGIKGCSECFRGLLCSKCNFVLGSAGDSINVLAAAVSYLTAWRDRQK